jgi:L-fuculose-phosphate aldolase
MTDEAMLAQAQAVGRELAQAGLVFEGAGNASFWTPDAVVITRDGAPLHRLLASDLCRIDRTTMPPVATPSLDTPIHRAIYVATGAKAILHAHPPHVIALSLDRHEFLPDDLEGAHLLGRVRVVSPRRNIVEVVAGALEQAAIAIVAGHGTYARGADLWECLRWTAALEASARVTWLRAAGRRPSTSEPPE